MKHHLAIVTPLPVIDSEEESPHRPPSRKEPKLGGNGYNLTVAAVAEKIPAVVIGSQRGDLAGVAEREIRNAGARPLVGRRAHGRKNGFANGFHRPPGSSLDMAHFPTAARSAIASARVTLAVAPSVLDAAAVRALKNIAAWSGTSVLLADAGALGEAAAVALSGFFDFVVVDTGALGESSLAMTSVLARATAGHDAEAAALDRREGGFFWTRPHRGSGFRWHRMDAHDAGDEAGPDFLCGFVAGFVAGRFWRGLGIEDSIRAGRHAARRNTPAIPIAPGFAGEPRFLMPVLSAA